VGVAQRKCVKNSKGSRENILNSMQAETFVPLSREELSLREERIKRIRELSADYLATLKRIA
jgi:hypothetical protein